MNTTMLAHEKANTIQNQSIQALHADLGLERIMKYTTAQLTRTNFNEKIHGGNQLLCAMPDGKMPSC